MLTRTFLLSWYTAMMTRIDHSGFKIKEEYRKKTRTPVTDVDLLSRTILTDGWSQTGIISEETYTHKQGRESVVTWVNPIDATEEYTKGLTQYVSVSACLTQNGQVQAGIVHFPFQNETWAVIGNEWLERPSMSFNPPNTVLISEQTELSGDEVLNVAGIGYKAAEVLKGRAKAYIQTSLTKSWDICAIDALFRASNGTFVNWKKGKPFNYTTDVHENGLYASTTTTLAFFKLTYTIQKPAVQIMFVLALWCICYFYPDVSLEQSTSKSRQLGFKTCAVVLLTVFVIRDIVQERIMTTEYDGHQFQWPMILVFMNHMSAYMFACYFVSVQTTPSSSLTIASLSNVISTLCQHSALQYTTFPIIVVFKSLKMIPVLLVGTGLFKQKYNFKAYLFAGGLSIGVLLPFFSTRLTSNAFSSIGFVFLISYVFADALTSQWQSHLFRTYKTPPLEMMYGVNLYSTLFTGCLVLTTGQLDTTVDFVIEHPTFIVHVFGLCITTVIGQWFIFKTVENHGAAVFSMIMTAKQAVSLMISGHRFELVSYIGIGIVFTILLIKTRVPLEVRAKYMPLAQKESGYDDLEQYSLESDSDEEGKKD